MVTIRRFTCDDAKPIQQRLYPDMMLSRIFEMIDEWNSCACNDRRFEMFAVIFDERLVGYVSLMEHSKLAASIGVEIIPEEWGKGVASQAVCWLMQYASEKGYLIMLDQVRKDNTASVRLHEKLEFESDGYIYRNQHDHEIFLYMKLL